MTKIVVTGAAGLIGQNLTPRLKARGYQIVGIDKHPTNTKILRELHPDIDFAALGRRLGDTAALAHLRDRLRTLYKSV